MRHGLRILGMAAAVALVCGGPAVAQQGNKELSEKSVTTLMNYAWTILPQKFTAPNGRTIEVDKKKRDALVPVETGREVIKAGYMSAQAQLCDMLDAQVANYNALMARERSKNKWTDQQLLYITTLHRMTIHMAAGKMRVVDKGTDEAQIILEPIEASKDTCKDDKKKKVVEAIEEYVKTAPKLAAQPQPSQQGAAPAPAQPTPAAAAQTVPASQPLTTKDQKK